MWGRLELPPGVEVDHPAVKGSTIRACPSCVGIQPDWQQQMLVALGITVEVDFRREAAQ